MHYALVMIGAHDGSKNLPAIVEASRDGKVLLVEPVPFLFQRLRKNVAQVPNVILANICISTVDGMVEFTAPKEASSTLGVGFDQIGSLSPKHATNHHFAMADHVEPILAESMTFASLVREYDITSLEMLLTDMEGFDCELLPGFPFARVLPNTIVFEFRHSDGTFRVGRKLARLLTDLDDLGYDIKVRDIENMIATLRTKDATAGVDPPP